ncbi:hypothetical protein AB835_13215 [Candidatus Endobugula sertula]|uniref:Uncharacterized protein n=1 Tax=Candidatus Endobugula sertula TaxID=62101 RepID=A0A1D2QM04_9GAMM|nr:hypothetical protein AB835_13215 [Candidatus Endobugula sertula]
MNVKGTSYYLKTCLSPVACFIALMGLSTSVTAFDWQLDNHTVLTGDPNNDGVTDIYLQPATTTTEVEIPYNITLNLNTRSAFRDTVISGDSNNSSFSLAYPAASATVQNPTWQDNNDYTRLLGDFNGDGYQDILLQPNQSDLNGLVVTGFGDNQQPTILYTLSATISGVAINSTVTTLLIRDVNNDGLDDIVLQQAGQSDRVLLSQDSGDVSPLLAYPLCQTSEQLTDADCDGTADRYESQATRYNPQQTTPFEQALAPETIGTINGNVIVAVNGTVNYTLPLTLPPAIADIAPDIALAYNQEGSNGLVGMGWSVAGLSSIRRCATTIVQDGYINGVNFNSSDQYCFNGERLINIGNNEYRTENDTFAKIIAVGSAGNGPASFTVYQPSGDIEYYGATTNAKRQPQSGSAIYQWALNRVQDREGNTADYTYHNNTANGEFRITRIDYNANTQAGQSHNTSVRFEYENRNDITPAYTDSILTTINQRLRTIRTTVDNTQVRYYQLSYTSGANQRSLLASVQECLASGDCLPQTTFTWDKGLATEAQLNLTEDASHPGFTASVYTDQRYQLGDVNADGKADVVWTYRDNNQLGRVVFLANAAGTGFEQQPTQLETGYFAGVVDDESQQYLLGDINGDGKSDLIWIARHIDTVVRTIYLANEQGTGFVSQGYELDVNPRYNEFLQGKYRLADVNGDNLQDLVWVYHHNNRIGINTYLTHYNGNQVYLGKVSELIDADLSPDFYQHQEFDVGDVNGDGKSDVVWTFRYQNTFYRMLYLANAAGSGFTKISLGSDAVSNTGTNYNTRLGDINGDGKADLVWTYNNGNQLTRTVYLASRLGTSFDKKSSLTDTSLLLNNHSFQRSRLADINGDGRQDLIYSYVDNTDFGWVAYLADLNGEGFTRHTSGSQTIGTGTANHEYRFADVTGNGKSDLVWTFNTSTGTLRRQTLTQADSYADHLTGVTDGLNNTASIQYRYLANDPNYSQASTVNYPIRNDAGIRYVVNQVQRSNGIGGLNTTSYRYQGARTHLQGRGFLGFAQRSMIDQQRQLTTTEYYRQAFPFIGDTSRTTVANSSHTIEEIHNDWQQTANNNNRTVHRYLHRQAVIKRNLNNGQEQTVSVLNNTYNHTYGYVQRSITQTGRGYSNYALSTVEQTVTTDYQYALNTADWRIRFVSEESKTWQASNESNRTVVRRFTPYSSTSLLTQTETDFADSNVEQTRTYTRDAFGNIIQATTSARDINNTSAAAQTQTVNNYTRGLFADITTNAEGHNEQHQFDARYGTLTRHKDANGLLTDSRYDGFGHLLFTRQPDGSQTRYDYQLCNNNCPAQANHAHYAITQTTTHPNVSGQAGVKLGAPTVISYYDQQNRVVATQTTHDNGSHQWVQTRYDALGRISQQSQPYLTGGTVYWTQFQYDVLDRTLQETRPDGGRTQTEYLASNSEPNHSRITATVTAPDRATTTLVSNLYQNTLGQLRRSVDANGTPTHFAYDAQGHLREVVVNNNTATRVTIETDSANNRTRLLDPDAGDIRYEFDGFARERRRTYIGAGPNNSNQTVTSTYDKLNRLIQRIDNDGSQTQTAIRTANWNYDPTGALGQLASSQNNNYQQTVDYDALTRVQATHTQLLGESAPKTLQYTYDFFSRPQTKRYPNNVAVEYQYNTHGYHQATRNANTQALYREVLQRNAYGEITQERLGNGVTTNRNYDLRMGRIAKIATQSTNANQYQQLSYLHDSAGNLLQRRSQRNSASENLTETFQYDNLHRLTAATTTGLNSGSRTITHAYDALGNITQKSDRSDVNGYTYGEGSAGAHAVTRIEHNGQTTIYQYDSKGNMIARGDQNLTYSVFNKPTHITETNTTTQFQFGPDRQRFYQDTTHNSTQTKTRYYNADYKEVERAKNNKTTQRAKVTVGDYLIIATQTSGNTQLEDHDYLHRDHLGSVEATSNRLGQFTGRFAFDPWGERRNDNWENKDINYQASIDKRTFESTTKGFTDHEHLDAVNLIHMNGRVYDPLIGRFLSPDDYVQFPESSQSYNRYTYVLNNPLSYTDPSGEAVFTTTIAVIAALVKAYEVITTISDAHETITDDNLTTGEKALELTKQTAVTVAAPPGGKIAVKQGRKILNKKAKPEPETKNKQVSSQKSKDNKKDGSAEKPVFEVSRSTTPQIAENISTAISKGAPTTLARETSKKQIRKNRRDALRGKKAAGPGKSLDEFPFASTKQGGKGACVSAVCAKEQSIQGGQLSQFFKKNKIKDGDEFDVKVVD